MGQSINQSIDQSINQSTIANKLLYLSMKVLHATELIGDTEISNDQLAIYKVWSS